MTKVSIYSPLSLFLQKQKEAGVDEVKLTFDDIEKLICKKLPDSARKYKNWWGNSYKEKGRQCSSWLDYGWSQKHIDLIQEIVIFQYLK